MLYNHRKGIILAAVGTFFFSTSPVLTLWLQGVSPAQITFLRMLIASLFIALAAFATGTGIRIHQKDMVKLACIGAITAAHFWFYIASLFYTSIAHCLSIVYTAPVFVTLFSAVVLKERLERHRFFGIALVIAGVFILTGFEPQMTQDMIIGDLLAFGSALSFGLYSVAGRKERENYPLLKYTFWVYLFAAVFLAPGAVLNFKPVDGYKIISALVLLALLPTTLGHTMYNASLRYTHPTYSNLISTQEITGGVALGYLVFGQAPGLNVFVGCVVMFLGLAGVRLNKNSNLRKILQLQEKMTTTSNKI